MIQTRSNTFERVTKAFERVGNALQIERNLQRLCIAFECVFKTFAMRLQRDAKLLQRVANALQMRCKCVTNALQMRCKIC